MSWSTPIHLISSHVSGFHTPWIASNGNKIICIWHDDNIHRWPRINAAFSVSINYGQSWTPPQYILSSGYNGYFMECASGSGDNISVTMIKYVDEDSGHVYDVRSSDFGNTWTTPRRLFKIYQHWGQGDQISLGNFVHFVFPASFDADDFPNLVYVKSTNGGATWADYTLLFDTDEMWEQAPKICADQYGNVGVLWLAWRHLSLRVSHDFGVNWGAEFGPVSDSIYPSGEGDINIEGNTIYFAWEDVRFYPHSIQRNIFINYTNDEGQNWGQEYWLDQDSMRYSLIPSIAASKGRIYAIWYDAGNDPGNSNGLYFSRWPDWPDAVDENEDNLPSTTSLSVHPNPFNGATTISYHGMESGGTLGIYDIAGRRVRTLALDRASGSVNWDAKDDGGEAVSSGIYIARVIESPYSASSGIKLVYLK